LGLLIISQAVPGIAYPYLINWFLDSFGLTGTWLMISGITMHAFTIPVMTWLYRSALDMPTTNSQVSMPSNQDSTEHQAKQLKLNIVSVSGKLTPSQSNHSPESPPTKSNKTLKGKMNDAFSLEPIPTYDALQQASVVTEISNGRMDDLDITIPTPSGPHDTDVEKQSAPLDSRSTDVGHQTKHDKESRHTSLTRLKSVLTNKPFVFLAVGTSTVLGGVTGFMSLIIDIADWKTFSDSQALLLLIPYSICNTLTRPVTSFLSQRDGINPYVMPSIFLVCAILVQLVNNYTAAFELFFAGMCILGITNGSVACLGVALASHLVTDDELPIAMGLVATVIGISGAASSPIFGKYE